MSRAHSDLHVPQHLLYTPNGITKNMKKLLDRPKRPKFTAPATPATVAPASPASLTNADIAVLTWEPYFARRLHFDQKWHMSIPIDEFKVFLMEMMQRNRQDIEEERRRCNNEEVTQEVRLP